MTTETAAAKKVHVIRLLPTGNSPADRQERAHLQASKWLVTSAPKGEAVAGRAYLVTVDIAASLVRKGWTLCDSSGKPIAGELPTSDKVEIRPGTEAWYELPLDQRPGTEEFRAAELDRQLQAAYIKEQQEMAKAHIDGKHAEAADPNCQFCAHVPVAEELEAAQRTSAPVDAPSALTGGGVTQDDSEKTDEGDASGTVPTPMPQRRQRT